jgi:signal transduction histidine kinase/HAMP domain-containing protein
VGLRGKTRFADLRLGTKLLFLFILISILPLLVSATYVVGYLSASSAAKARSDLAGGLAKAAIVIDKRWAEIERIARASARDNLVTINLELFLDSSIRDYLELSKATQSLDYMGIVNAGLSIRIEGGSGRGLEPVVAAIGPEPFRRSLVEGDTPFAVSVPGAGAPRVVLGAIAPVYSDSGAILGYIVAGDVLGNGAAAGAGGGGTTLLGELRAAVGAPILVLSGGSPVAYSEAELAATSFAPLGLPAIGEAGLAVGGERLAIGGQAYLFRFRALSVAEGSPTVLVGLGFKEDEIMSARNQTFYGFVFVFLAALGISVLFAFFFSRSLTKPIHAMVEGTRRIVQGDFEFQIPVGSGDEVGLLSQEFNEMSRRLGSSLSELQGEVEERSRVEVQLQELNESLERRIEERTQELSEANRELEETVSYLNSTRDQLVESEKMAALGQLVASIAHEINTPLGAISSSSEGMAGYIEALLLEAPPMLALLDVEGREAYDYLFSKALHPRSIEAASKDDRIHRKALGATLEAHGVAAPPGTADDLVEVGLTELPAEGLAFLSGPNGLTVLDLVLKAFWLVRSQSIISIASDKAAASIRALKNYAHVEAGTETSEFSLLGEIESILSLYYGKLKSGIELRRRYDEVPPLRGQRDLLNQVWINLLNNALQAMDYRGTLEIAIFPAEDGFVGVSFADDGPGIPEALRDKIFKPFFSTKKRGEGSGLGLSICKKIVEEHGGRIAYESRPGRTVFTVQLPCWRQ